MASLPDSPAYAIPGTCYSAGCPSSSWTPETA